MGFGTLQRCDSWARLKHEGLKRFQMSLVGKQPKEIDISIQEKDEFELYAVTCQTYEIKCQLMVNAAESEDSPIIGGFPAGTYVTILSIGSTCLDGRRLKVANKSKTVIGWVSSIARGKPSLCKTEKRILDFSPLKSLRSNVRRRSNSLSSLSAAKSPSVTKLTKVSSKADLDRLSTKSPMLGDLLQIDSRVVVREDESMSSPQILSIAGGCTVRILDFGKTSENRVKVSVNGVTGWITILDKSNVWEPPKSPFGIDRKTAPRRWNTY